MNAHAMTSGSGAGVRLVSALLACILLVMPLEAQQRRGLGTPPRDQLEGMVRERFQTMVARELGLDAEQAGALQRIAETHQSARREMIQRSLQLRRRLATVDATLGADEAATLLAEVVAVQDAEAALLRSELADLRTVLSAPQTVRFLTLRDRLTERLRRLRDGGGPPGGMLRPR